MTIGGRHDYLEPGAPDGEQAGLTEMAELLEAQRPVPSAGFRGRLGRHLSARSRGAEVAPARLRWLVGAYAGSGAALLAIAAIGLAGIGPFGAG